MNKNKLQSKVIPGDNPTLLICLYSIAALLLTLVYSLRYFNRFDIYVVNVNGVVKKEVQLDPFSIVGSNSFWGEENLNLALKDIFVGTTVFIILCCLMILRNYLYFRTKSKSIYLMRRISDTHELTRRCLTLPVFFIVLDIVLTVILLIIYIQYYCTNIEVDHVFNLWNVLL